MLFILVLTLTGCSKKLTCKNSTESFGTILETETTINYKWNKVDYINVTFGITAKSDEMKKNWSVAKATFSKTYEEKEEEGLKVKTSSDDTNYKYLISIDVDPKKAKKEDLEKYSLQGLVGANYKINDAKKDLEKEGYTCK